MTDRAITETLEGKVLVVTFAREAKLNAITRAMYDDLHAAFDRASVDPGIVALVLLGRGKAFTAGNDLVDFHEHPPQSIDSPVGRFLVDLLEFPKPLLAGVRGPAMGIGTTLLLHCDLVYATSDARFQFPFTRLGLCPEAGASVLLPLVAGYSRASAPLLWGEPFSATDALDLRIVHAVVPDDALESRILERAHALEALPPTAVATTKRLLQQGRKALIEGAMQRESEAFFERLRSPEAKEAFAAFREKRAPDFSRTS